MSDLLLTFCGHVVVSKQRNTLPRDAASHPRRTVTSAQGLSEETVTTARICHVLTLNFQQIFHKEDKKINIK
jgi:hypothetical protein